jgi:T5SS/PEP-CTERM-associated repeat protein
MTVLDAGQVISGAGTTGSSASASNNTVMVSGLNAVWTNSGQLTVGDSGANNQLVITTSGQVSAANVIIGSSGAGNQMRILNGGQMINGAGTIGSGSSASNNMVMVSGPNSVWTNSGQLRIGNAGANSQLIITNGGRVYANTSFSSVVGAFSTSVTNFVLVTGAGSLLQNQDAIMVGSVPAGGTTGQGTVLVTDGGTLEANTLYGGTGGSGTISNRGGIYQFATLTPSVVPNTAGAIMMSNATVSYRGVVGADINNVQVGNISKSGNNTFQLNNSTNTNPGSYKFDSVANTGNPTNYQRLVLLNNSRWVSSYLTNGVGGAIKGGAGDVVEVTREFRIERSSNPSAEFDLASSEVTFTGGIGHTNAITGKDFGHSATLGFADGFTAINFSYGKLSLGSSSDTVCFESGDGSVSNAMYINWLDLGGNVSLVANLHAETNINLYYFNSNPNNAYLGNNVYQLTDCDGGVGGLLMPAVPEPSALVLLSMAGVALLWRRRRG